MHWYGAPDATRWMTWLKTPTKDAASCNMLWRGACGHWTRDIRMWLHIWSERIGNAGNWNVLVPAGKETNWDALSKSDRKAHKANRILNGNIVEMWCYKLPFYSEQFYSKFSGKKHDKEWQSRSKKSERCVSILSKAYRNLGLNLGDINFQL